MDNNELINPVGQVFIEVKDANGNIEYIVAKNKILRLGRIGLAKAITNDFGAFFDLFVISMVFGSGGTSGGTPRVVEDTREGLFGPTILTKGVISTIDPVIPTQATFTSVVTFDEAIGQTINEMALQLHSEDFFSMVTFGDISKSISIQLTFNWKINFIG